MSGSLEKQQWSQDWKRSVFISIAKKGSTKEFSNYWTFVLIYNVSKAVLKTLQARLHITWTKNFQMFKLDLEKAEEPEIKLPIFIDIKKAREFKKEKNIFLFHWLC